MPNLVNKDFVTGAMRTGFSRRFANPKLQPNCGVSLQLYRLLAWPKNNTDGIVIDHRLERCEHDNGPQANKHGPCMPSCTDNVNSVRWRCKLQSVGP